MGLVGGSDWLGSRSNDRVSPAPSYHPKLAQRYASTVFPAVIER